MSQPTTPAAPLRQAAEGSGKVMLTSADLLARMIALCEDGRAENVVALDMRELVDYVDTLLLVTGRSPRQNRALAEHVRRTLHQEADLGPLSVSGLEGGIWICLDYVDVVLHVFEPETRVLYDLEMLWADAQRTTYPPSPPAAGAG